MFRIIVKSASACGGRSPMSVRNDCTLSTGCPPQSSTAPDVVCDPGRGPVSFQSTANTASQLPRCWYSGSVTLEIISLASSPNSCRACRAANSTELPKYDLILKSVSLTFLIDRPRVRSGDKLFAILTKDSHIGLSACCTSAGGYAVVYGIHLRFGSGSRNSFLSEFGRRNPAAVDFSTPDFPTDSCQGLRDKRPRHPTNVDGNVEWP